MSTLSQFTGSSQRVASVVNSSSGTSGTTNDYINGSNITRPVKKYVVGSTTANVLKTAVSVTGSGAINWCALWQSDTTSRTLRIKVTIDSRVIYDVVSATNATAQWGLLPIGSIVDSGGASFPIFQRIPFESSLLIEAASSLTEAGTALIVGVNYEVNV
jgi:hypothetical protein